MQIKDYLLFLFPVCIDKWEEIDKLIDSKKIKIINKIEINLTETGKFNLIKNIYKNEDWLGNRNNNYEGLYYKLNSCFRLEDKKVKIYFIKTDRKELIKAKTEIRDLCNIGNHSVHSTDTVEEFEFLSKYYNNINTIKYLNTIKEIHKNNRNFIFLFNKLKRYIKSSNINADDFCLSGSSVLSVFNLRDCYDIDLLCSFNIKNIYDKIENYNNYYLSSNFFKEKKITINEIINNEEYYFYYDGLKFMSLELIKEFKKIRNEKKDQKDILLIERILNNENYRC